MFPTTGTFARFTQLNAPQPGEDGAAILSKMPSISNVSADMTPFDTRGVNAEDTANIEGLRDTASTALGASPAIQALRQAADARNLQALTNERTHLNDLESGVPQDIATHEAGVENAVGDLLSEGAARRNFLPYKSEENDRQAAAKEHALELQYLAGPQMKANTDLQIAQMNDATKRAEIKPQATPVDILRAALAKRFAAGQNPSDDDVNTLKHQLGIQ